MLERSPRRKLFNDYAKQLMRRYPNMKDEIIVRLTHLNNQWERLQKAMAPSEGLRDRDTMIRGIYMLTAYYWGFMVQLTFYWAFVVHRLFSENFINDLSKTFHLMVKRDSG